MNQDVEPPILFAQVFNERRQVCFLSQVYRKTVRTCKLPGGAYRTLQSRRISSDCANLHALPRQGQCDRPPNPGTRSSY